MVRSHLVVRYLKCFLREHLKVHPHGLHIRTYLSVYYQLSYLYLAFCIAIHFLLFISEILILGCGRHIEQVDPELRRYIQSTGMKLEAVDSVFIII